MKNMISRLILVAMLFSVFAVPAAAESEESSEAEVEASVSVEVEDFTDVEEDHDNFDAIEYLQDGAIVEGYDDGSYKPENEINRAEFLKILMVAQGYETGGEDCYSDVADEWFAEYVCAATDMGLVKGYDDGEFKPWQTINFAEASKIVANAMALAQPEGGEEAFDYWYQPYVMSLEVLEAVPTSITSFSYEITRGEMAEMIYRVAEAANLGYMDHKTYRDIHNEVLAANYAGELQEFDSCSALSEHIELNSSYYYEYYTGLDSKDYWEVEYMEGFVDDDVDFAEEESAGSSADAESSVTSSAEKSSSTNVQVAGVDEADIVKNDGEYIYVVQDNKVHVVKASPVEEMNAVSEITFGDGDFYPSEMYVDGDRLVVVGDVYSYMYDEVPIIMEEDAFEETVYGDYYNWEYLTKVYIVDISDKEEPEVLRDFVFEGDYSDSRKVDDTVYLVLNQYEYYYDYEPTEEDLEILPLYYDSAVEEVMPISDCGDVMYYPGVDETNYLVLAAIPVSDDDAEVDKEVIMGASGTVYSSRENMYVAEANYNWFAWDFDDYSYEEETVINKFALGDASVEFAGQGSVPGTVLNQFSMDEDGDYFRIATTEGNSWDGTATNSLYVLNSDMEVVGALTDIAPGEDIYSVRFMGDRAYMVTFLKVDPFFVIDVSEPTAPEILGELKIPGYSDYLHPYGENYMIGIGKDTEEADEDNWWGTTFAWYQGLKIAMFDVTDLENPQELHTVVIGDRGTDSEVLWNHKAFLFDEEMGLMALPVDLYELSDEVKESSHESWEYGDFVWQGAYVYDVSAEDGFQLRGKITHYDAEVITNDPYYYYGYNDIKRILYIGDVLYTVSEAWVKANELESLEEIDAEVLPFG